jgi:hypothetical protein
VIIPVRNSYFRASFPLRRCAGTISIKPASYSAAVEGWILTSYPSLDRGCSPQTYFLVLARVFAIAILCVAFGRGIATPSAVNSSPEEAPSYEAWMAAYRLGPLQMDDGTIRTIGAGDGPRPIIVITAVEGDDLKPDEHTAELFGQNYTVISYGCSVSSDGRVFFFSA